MEAVKAFFKIGIEIHTGGIIGIAIICVIVHELQRRFYLAQFLYIALNYIPVLIHEMGHILFNRLSGGKVEDLVIVVSPKERSESSRQGFAITKSINRFNESVTTLGGYMMPPLMLYLGVLAINYQYPSVYIVAYLLIFSYFLIITSRKIIPLAIVIVILILMYYLMQQNISLILSQMITMLYNYILGVLLGEILISSWLIIVLTLKNNSYEWDGSVIQKQTHLPTILFSLLWLATNFYSIYFIF